MIGLIKRMFFIAGIILLSGCASMPTDFEQPTFSIMNVELTNAAGLNPQFEITLRVTNPNRITLEIVGMSYDVYLEGNKVVSGVANEFPVIAPYGEDSVRVVAQLNIMGSINLLRDLARRTNNSVSYEFDARLDIGPGYPIIPIGESGEIRL